MFDGLSGGLSELAARLRPSSVQVRGRTPGGGSGVIWTDGVIVTNAHVARGDDTLVDLSDGRTLEAKVVSRDPHRDLAALQVEARDLTPASIGDASRLRVGDLVAAMGNPLGVVGALTTGIVHATGNPDWIEADVHLAPGNSGGMLADASGEVIGINTMIANGIGLAIPSGAVEAFLTGKSSKPLLGITMHPVAVRMDGGTRPALAILRVEPGGAADRAGIAVGDVLLATPPELVRRPLELNYLRGGKLRQCVVGAKAA